MLKKFLRKQNLVPCVISNLKHSLFIPKGNDQVYIFFQMSIHKKNKFIDKKEIFQNNDDDSSEKPDLVSYYSLN